MKMLLTNEEVLYMKKFAKAFDMNFNAENDNVITILSNEKATEVNINDEFIVDIINILCTIAPLYKGLFSHLESVVSLFKNLCETIELKWAKKTDNTTEEEAQL